MFRYSLKDDEKFNHKHHTSYIKNIKQWFRFKKMNGIIAKFYN